MHILLRSACVALLFGGLAFSEDVQGKVLSGVAAHAPVDQAVTIAAGAWTFTGTVTKTGLDVHKRSTIGPDGKPIEGEDKPVKGVAVLVNPDGTTAITRIMGFAPGLSVTVRYELQQPPTRE